MTQHKHTLYISDLDGTLLDERSQISDETAETLNRLIDKGMLFSIATARTPATVVGLMKDVEIKLPVILMTGALIYDIAHNKYLSVSSFLPDVSARIVDAVSTMGVSPMIYYIENSLLHVSYGVPLTDKQLSFMEERTGTPFKKYVARGGGITIPAQTVMIFFMGQYEQLEHIYKAISAIEGHCSYLYRDSISPEQGYLEIYPQGTSKATAIKQLAALTHAEEVVVFGDNINDIPMFSMAHRSYAVCNAVDEVKRQATATIASNTENGVVRFLTEDYTKAHQETVSNP